MMNRRAWLWGAAGAATLAATPAWAQAAPLVEVWKDPNCGCCNDWIRHLESHGFRVQAFDTGNTGMRQRLGMPLALGSCHTARVGGYVIEGHVPATDIQRLLRERPVALGLSVPRMPVGSPGMDGPEYGGRRDPYDVLLVQRDGSTRVWASYHRTQAPAAAPSADRWAEGEVRRIDAAARKITLRHGDIPDLDMPPMTMVFQVRDAALLQGLQPGARVRFRAEKAGGTYFVTEIKPAP
ncbi:hypothetical protein Ttaiw_02638 [Tepidimonas taiwanensis]|uniref:Uncharacterized protein n=2 Tax=Tepidimonas taiwanensis TaxID=307486 RepID=A0A554WXL9_9BURK|nr:DUF411 domain-containing protein [Tepidimonas taiwanensis]TSE28317.1 hypothetical protein Ttaiw_02638 [Tepidimonas taiwanensis]